MRAAGAGEHRGIVLWAVGILFLLTWAIGLLTVPHIGWYRHLPLVVALVALGYAILKPREAKP